MLRINLKMWKYENVEMPPKHQLSLKETSSFSHFHISGFLNALVFLTLSIALVSCGSYNRQIGKYYEHVKGGQYDKADASIDNNKKLQLSRNRLLYLLEKGKMAHLLKQYENSNRYFNEADLFMEDARTTAGDIVLGTLLNPMMQTYKGEDFEKFMVHYYKALNYLYLGQTSEAMVEARRISLQNYALQDKKNDNQNRYSDDAFSLMLQGIIYEHDRDINNAFISYRNAADIYLRNNNSYYGVQLPLQLKKDVLRTAALNGFTDEVGRYEKLFNLTYQKEEATAGGELVLFWENGLAPVKQEQNFFFSLTKNGAGDFFFVDPTGAFSIPFDTRTSINRDDPNINDLRTFRVAFPKYQEQPLQYAGASAMVNSQSYSMESAEDINALAFATLKERFLKDMSLTLSRLAVKKLAEAAARPKKDDKNKNEREALAVAIQAFSFISEKADTRNWQSLPHTIYYTRIPLAKGNNTITLQPNGSSPISFNIDGTGQLQLQNVCTLY
jgi:uncharacterized protein